MSAVKDLFDQIMKAIDKKTKKAGSDYTGKVTRVEGDTAYVQFDGSEINDTPVQLSIGAKPGDKVNIRVVNGKASLIGNVTEPPTNDGEKIKEVEEKTSHIKETTDQVVISVGKKMNSDMSNRPSSIVIDSGKIAFESNSIVIDSDNLKVYENGDAKFSGKLEAAEGTFDGTLSFTWGEDNPQMKQTILIGESTDVPFMIKDVSTGSGAGFVTTLAAGEIILSDGRFPPTQATGDIYNGWQHTSDEKLKHNIEDLEGLDLVMRLRPVTFVYNGDPNETKRYGFIAQNVQEVIAEAVSEKDGFLMLSYESLIAPAIAAIQEQQTLIQKLIDRVESLERRVDDGK